MNAPQPAARTLQHDWQQWLAAWREAGGNPLARYFALAERRRLAAIPGWRRRLPYVLVAALAASPAVIVLLTAAYDWWTGAGDPGYVVVAGVIMVLVGISTTYVAFLLGTLYNTALTVMNTVAQPGVRVRGQVLDDLAAITLLSDREVVVALVRIHWPPLIRLSLLGAGVLWLWAINASVNFWEQGLAAADDSAVFSLILLCTPLTLCAITLAGALAGLVFVLALIALGNGLTRTYAASMTGFSAAVANMLYCTITAGMATYISAEEAFGFGVYISEPRAIRLIAAILFAAALVALVWLLLLLAEKWPAGRAFIAPSAPLLALAGYALLGFSLYLASTSGHYLDDQLAEAVMTGYPLSWGALPLVNCFALPGIFCLGAWPEHWWGQTPFEWFRYPLLLGQQLALIAVAAHFARRAVQLRRRNLA